ncbi:cupredoxin domain-containing protein [Tepidibacillus marianensis]|uniref:cupredoxin domain-containing protein n=1 Tax=Tepidibacillus marianensis TaxID=3131995 RepID=UPI0030CE62E9
MKKGILLFLIGLLTIGILVGCGQSSSNNVSSDSSVQTVHIVASEWKFTTDTTTVKPGKVKLVVENKGTRMHGFAIDQLGIKESIQPGQTFEKVVTIDQPSDLTYYCTVLCGDLDQHEGMKGTLKIQK